MIISFYRKDGTKERRPVGYGGGLCSVATAPYEAREIPGQMRKTPTPEANMEPAVAPEKVAQKQSTGAG